MTACTATNREKPPYIQQPASVFHDHLKTIGCQFYFNHFESMFFWGPKDMTHERNERPGSDRGRIPTFKTYILYFRCSLGSDPLSGPNFEHHSQL